MASLIMVKVNALFRKGYLLAGVMMAANMLIVNEVKASTTMNPITTEQPKKTETISYGSQPVFMNVNLNEQSSNKNMLNNPGEDTSFPKNVLNCKNYINLICGMASSGVNNYFKWWNYNPGIYWSLGFFGWRTKRFLNDYLQLEVNLNVYRGLGWGILHIVDLLKTKPEKGNEMGLDNIKKEEIEETKEENTNENKTLNKNGIGFEKAPKTDNSNFKNFIFSCAPGFISAPLTIHISKFDFSISISIDSLIWIGIGKILDRTKEVKDEKDNNHSTDISNSAKGEPVKIVTKI